MSRVPIIARRPTPLILLPSPGSVQATEAEAINTNVNPSQLLYISLSFGFSLTVCAWIFFRVSGGLFNPAVSLALALVGAVTPGRAALLTLAQILGAITAAGLIEGLLPGPLLVKTSLNNGISIAQGASAVSVGVPGVCFAD